MAIDNPLDRAKRGLQFEDIFQATTDAWRREDFDPRFHPDGQDLLIQFKHVVTQSNLIEVKTGEQETLIFRVHIDVGIRIVAAAEDGNPKSTESPIGQIEASYRVDYRITDKELSKDQEGLDAFALQNASYHLWPYWREFVMSQSQRMNLPKIALPLRLVKSPNDTPPPQNGKSQE